jgi:hypothetical protein
MNFLRDYLWIKAIVYFGKHFETDKSCRWFYHLLDVVSTLDPYFESAYEIGGVALAYWEKDQNLSIKLLKKGMVNLPKIHEPYWRILFFLGYNNMYYKKNFATAAHYLEEAIKYLGYPRYLPFLVARLYSNAKDPKIAIKFLQEIYRSTENEETKKDINSLNYLLMLRLINYTGNVDIYWLYQDGLTITRLYTMSCGFVSISGTSKTNVWKFRVWR